MEWLRLSAIKSGQSECDVIITAQNICRNLGFEETDIIYKDSENEGNEFPSFWEIAYADGS